MGSLSASRSARLCALLLACLAAPACGGREPAPEPPAGEESGAAQWEGHLAEYTRGWVGAEQTLVFRFAHPAVAAENLGKPLDGIVRLTPETECTALFSDESTLEVRHPRPFPSGRKLGVVLLPDRLLNLPAGMPPLRYTVQVLEQGISVREIGLSADRARPDGMRLEGELVTSDSAAPRRVEAVLRATQSDRALPIAWQHLDSRRHRFTVKGIVRGSEPSQVTVAWDAGPLGIRTRGERTVDIPPLRQFAVTSVRAVQTPDMYVEVRFSDAVDTTQNLAGLARLDNADARAQWEGTHALRLFGSGKLKGDVRVRVSPGLRSARGETLGKEFDRAVTFAPERPAVRFAEKGHILPAASRLTVPFEAVAVRAVRVRAFEIYPGNIGQYLQDQALSYASDPESGYYEPYAQRQVGRYLWQETVTLPKVPLEGWERFDLDVTELVTNKKGSLIRLDLAVLPEFSAYACEAPPDPLPERATRMENYDGYDPPDPVPEHLQRYYESAGYYQWDERENPCSSSYYYHTAGTHASQIFFASSIGLLAKRGADDRLHVLATDLLTARPLPGAAVRVLNFQHQAIGSGTTDASGLLTLTVQGAPFYLEARKGGSTGSLTLSPTAPLPTAQFDTGGTRPEEGLKGFFYGERDIWRPGDDIYLTFVLMDRDQPLPADYPLTLDLFDPRGKKTAGVTNTHPVGGFYAFALRTEESAPTGNWRAVVRIGDHYFDQGLRVENIAPNRLRMDLSLPEKGLRVDQLPWHASLTARWLNGATAALLRTDVRLRLSAGTTVFDGYDGYRFDDQARSFTQEPQQVFEGTLDDTGTARFEIGPAVESPPPGSLRATFTERVFEPGGQFSTQYRSVPFYPFRAWAGIRAPAGNAAEAGALDRQADHVFDLVSLDMEGKPLPRRRLELTLIGIDWRWWWEHEEEDFSRYISDPVQSRMETATVTTDANGRAAWTLHGSRHDGGRYLVRVCDAQETGAAQHCASQDVCLGWGYGDAAGRDAATRMPLSTDRERYRVGDTAVVRLPDGPDRRAFVSVETGTRVLSRSWEDVSSAANEVRLAVTAEMTPNVYVFVAQLQPHQGRNNDLPLRTYGIVPVIVDDESTHLFPVIRAPEKVRPETAMEIEVSERTGRRMTYTVAVVDEGLLGVTDYRTPDPHDSFYRREALGVLTWDLFDLVVGAYGADLSRLLAVGGGDAVVKRDSKRERRFPPVVRFLGPFSLAAGARAAHRVDLPLTMGEVRVMVVAGDGRAFGKAEQSVKITQPLTLLSTLPRVLGPGEDVDLPVTVFVSGPPFGTATVRVETDESLEATRPEGQASFTEPGEQTVYLRLHARDRVGTAGVRVTAALGAETAREVIHIPVRSANPPAVSTESRFLAPAETWLPQSEFFGMLGTNTATLAVSRAPELGLERRLDDLIDFPHGCLEQTASAAFPQLFLPALAEIGGARTEALERNVRAAVQKLAGFQTAEGGFSAWPYGGKTAGWANEYAGHFLLEARQRGYAVPQALLAGWLAYQERQARDFRPDAPCAAAGQAYRLYTLALAGRPDAGAMNRLRDLLVRADPAGRALAGWMLGLAYQQAGLPDIAEELLRTAGDRPDASGCESATCGSPTRDLAVLLLLRHRLGQQEQAWQLGERLARDLAQDTWYSTQATAWALLSLAQTFGSDAGETRFFLRTGSAAEQPVATHRAVWMQALEAYRPGELAVRNGGDRPLHASLGLRGVPAAGAERAESLGLTLDARFTDTAGKPLEIGSLPQGQDFVAQVTVRNGTDQALENVALTQVIPSGWQIRNTRLEGASDPARLDHQDIRDDRLVSYVSLDARQGSRRRGRTGRGAGGAGDTVTVRMLLNASFSGRFYLPGWRAEPLYDASVRASVAGRWVEVLPR